MIRPRKMKKVELTVLDRDVDRVIEALGKRGAIHLSNHGADQATERMNADREADKKATGPSAKDLLQRIKDVAAALRVTLPEEPREDTRLPTPDDAAAVESMAFRVDEVTGREAAATEDVRKIAEAVSEASAFENLHAPFSDLEQLSYLTLRIGRIEGRKREEAVASLKDRALLIPLGDGDRLVAASSRKGRFALDAELKKAGFVPLAVPDGFTGIPADMLEGMRSRLAAAEAAVEACRRERQALAVEYGPALGRLCESWRMAAAVEALKASLESTKSAWRLTGWVPAAELRPLAAELQRLAGGRVAIRSFDPEEVAAVTAGQEKVPVSLDHGAFVGGFERLVFSYGAPLYGTIDPTPIVAISFTILFGLMFGDVGQGAILLLLGFLVGRKSKSFLSGFSRFSSPLMAVGLASMLVGLLDGEVFTDDSLLIRPTRLVTGLLTGHPVDRVLTLMPEKGSLDKLFLFFAFTIAVGAVLNSIGLLINIINQAMLRRWEKALFAKTGLAGACLFWYAIFLAIRLALGGTFAWFDIVGLAMPAIVLFLGPALWRLLSGQKPVLEHGLLVFFMEGFVELLESASSYVSNTVSFLRVGAFALSHAVLSFIVFTLSGMVASSAPGGPFFAVLVVLIGNAVIILLEGLIVAIQVVRLQYYEFFSKFFTETGVEYVPFRFRREVKS